MKCLPQVAAGDTRRREKRLTDLRVKHAVAIVAVGRAFVEPVVAAARVVHVRVSKHYRSEHGQHAGRGHGCHHHGSDPADPNAGLKTDS